MQVNNRSTDQQQPLIEEKIEDCYLTVQKKCISDMKEIYHVHDSIIEKLTKWLQKNSWDDYVWEFAFSLLGNNQFKDMLLNFCCDDIKNEEIFHIIQACVCTNRAFNYSKHSKNEIMLKPVPYMGAAINKFAESIYYIDCDHNYDEYILLIPNYNSTYGYKYHIQQTDYLMHYTSKYYKPITITINAQNNILPLLRLDLSLWGFKYKHKHVAISDLSNMITTDYQIKFQVNSFQIKQLKNAAIFYIKNRNTLIMLGGDKVWYKDLNTIGNNDDDVVIEQNINHDVNHHVYKASLSNGIYGCYSLNSNNMDWFDSGMTDDWFESQHIEWKLSGIWLPFLYDDHISKTVFALNKYIMIFGTLKNEIMFCELNDDFFNENKFDQDSRRWIKIKYVFSHNVDSVILTKDNYVHFIGLNTTCTYSDQTKYHSKVSLFDILQTIPTSISIQIYKIIIIGFIKKYQLLFKHNIPNDIIKMIISFYHL